jgi:membrane protease YdiL (CAAX protease family)
VVAITHGKTGLKEWIRPLLLWRVGLQWYVLVLFSYLMVAVVSFVGASLLTGGAGPSVLASMDARLTEMQAGLGLSRTALWLTLPVLLVYGMVVVPLYEELGWRGFALLRLQAHTVRSLPVS